MGIRPAIAPRQAFAGVPALQGAGVDAGLGTGSLLAAHLRHRPARCDP